MKKSILITGLALAATSAMYAVDVVPPGGPALWQVVSNAAPGSPVGSNPNVTGEKITSSVNTNGTSSAYWNNDTTDDLLLHNNGPGCYNIGCFMTGASIWDPATNPIVNNSTNLSPNLDAPVYLGNNDGTARSDFYFSGPLVAPGTQMLAEMATADDRDWLGWYNPAFTLAGLNAGNRGSAWDIIFAGGTSPGAVSNFTASPNFGLFFFDAPNGSLDSTNSTAVLAAMQGAPGASGAYLTESGKSFQDTGTQHFTVFARSAVLAATLPSEYWVGVEDFGTDHDYNDMIVHLKIVPEPGYFLLLSLGLGGLGLAHRRMRKAA